MSFQTVTFVVMAGARAKSVGSKSNNSSGCGRRSSILVAVIAGSSYSS